ncbi:MAG TPA: signal recognition particle receptor subunit alpha, partial [Burkholderiaceae bacterium]|nr:signal recognition particle receptor subunit alpha [Burkholderiaceae bacterium]
MTFMPLVSMYSVVWAPAGPATKASMNRQAIPAAMRRLRQSTAIRARVMRGRGHQKVRIVDQIVTVASNEPIGDTALRRPDCRAASPLLTPQRAAHRADLTMFGFLRRKKEPPATAVPPVAAPAPDALPAAPPAPETVPAFQPVPTQARVPVPVPVPVPEPVPLPATAPGPVSPVAASTVAAPSVPAVSTFGRVLGAVFKPRIEPTAEPRIEPPVERRIEPLAEPIAEPTAEPIAEPIAEPTAAPEAPEAPEAARRGSWMARLKQGLSKTRSNLAGLFISTRIDEALYEELETALLVSDAGVETTQFLLDGLRQRVKEQRLTDGAQVREALRSLLTEVLSPLEGPVEIDKATPLVMMITGVNGAGKTTSIGKLAHHLQREGKTILLAAGDTFRAAAREQLAEWGLRNGVQVVSQQGGDPAAVAFDAVSAGRARQTGVVIIDTAGRLPTQNHLMDELRKIRRVLAKAMDGAPHE